MRIEAIVGKLEAYFGNQNQTHCQAYAERQYLNPIMSPFLEQGTDSDLNIFHDGDIFSF